MSITRVFRELLLFEHRESFYLDLIKALEPPELIPILMWVLNVSNEVYINPLIAFSIVVLYALEGIFYLAHNRGED